MRLDAPSVAMTAGLPGGVAVLSFAAAVIVLATLALVVAARLGAPLPPAFFGGLAVSVAAAAMAAGWLTVHRLGPAYLIGLGIGAAPALAAALVTPVAHWDDFMHWLPNAVHLYRHGLPPVPGAPPTISNWPGYPPGGALALAAIWHALGGVVERAAGVLNGLCLLVLPGLLRAATGLPLPGRAGERAAVAAVLALAVTLGNPGLDWHWVLSACVDLPTAVAFAAAGWLAVRLGWIGAGEGAAWVMAAGLGALLALIVDLKQTGIVLVAVLLGAVVAVWRVAGPPERRRVSVPVLVLSVVPAAAVFLAWRYYHGAVMPGAEFSWMPLAQWRWTLLPEILGAVGRELVRGWPLFLPLVLVAIRGMVWLVATGWARLPGGGAAPAAADGVRLAAVFALAWLGFSAFLIACYLGAFSQEEALRAAEWFRYQAQLGQFGLLAGVVVIAERLRLGWSAGWVRAGRFRIALAVLPAAVSGGLAAAVFDIATPAPLALVGRAWPGVLSPGEIATLRAMGRAVAHEVGTDPARLVIVLNRQSMLTWHVLRYAIWRQTPAAAVTFDLLWHDDWRASWPGGPFVRASHVLVMNAPEFGCDAVLMAQTAEPGVWRTLMRRPFGVDCTGSR